MSAAVASRRALLSAGAAAAGLVGAAAPAKGVASSDTLHALPGALPAADRRLIGLYRLAECRVASSAGAMREGWAAEDAGDRTVKAAADAECAGHWDEYERAIEEMAALPAEDLAGLAAKVAAMALFAEHLRSGINDGEAELVESAAADAARHLVAMGAPDAPATLGWPDEDLLAACERWDEAQTTMEALSDDLALTPFDIASMERCWAIQARVSAALEDVIGLRAVTLPGRQAKAAILATHVARRDDPVSRLAASVAWDAMGPRA